MNQVLIIYLNNQFIKINKVSVSFPMWNQKGVLALACLVNEVCSPILLFLNSLT